jgi:hypothetical protein
MHFLRPSLNEAQRGSQEMRVSSDVLIVQFFGTPVRERVTLIPVSTPFGTTTLPSPLSTG